MKKKGWQEGISMYKRIAVVAGLACWLSLASSAQFETSTVLGTVTDPTGAFVSGA